MLHNEYGEICLSMLDRFLSEWLMLTAFIRFWLQYGLVIWDILPNQSDFQKTWELWQEFDGYLWEGHSESREKISDYVRDGKRHQKSEAHQTPEFQTAEVLRSSVMIGL